MTDSSPSLNTHRVPIAIVLTLTMLSGVVHGFLDGRWTEHADLEKVGSKLQDLPSQIGEWNLVDQSDLRDKEVEMLRCYGSQKILLPAFTE